MLIDWFTVGAQALNFLILVWLMKRYLYHPVLNAIDARDKRVAAEVASAAAAQGEAQTERDDFRQKNEAFDRERSTLLAKAGDDAKVERGRLIDEAREAATALAAAREKTLHNDARELSRTIGRQTRHEVFAVARQALTDLAAASLEVQMSDVFMRRLRGLDSSAKARLVAELAAGAGPATVRSAFDLPPAQRAALQRALKDALGGDVAVQFATAPELIGGVELVTHGQKLAWSIDDYLSTLEKRVDVAMSTNVAAQAPGQPGPVRPNEVAESRA